MEQKKRNKSLKIFSLIFVLCIVLLFPLCFAGCGTNNTVYITDIEKTQTVGLVDYYTIYYSDGTTSSFTITNGQDGQDADKVTINEIYEQYKEEYGDISYADFLKEYLTFNTDYSQVINSCLLSSLKIYSEFYVTTLDISSFIPQMIDATSISGGAGIIYKMDSDYTYVVTNYHVIYSSSANADNGSNFARKIVGYLYGSEATPTASGTSENGYTTYDYGDYAIEFELVGGSIDYDIAVLKVETDKILDVNSDAKAVEFAEEYYVGETAIAIGNPEGEGISVSQGIVSVDSEYIALNIDGTSRNYRSMRIDTVIYHGNSGGGLFNKEGKLIGVTNAGNDDDESINYAIPLEIVKGVVENILYYYDGVNTSSVQKITLGITVSGTDSKYVYDEISGYGQIQEKINIEEVSEGSIAENLGLQTGDIITAIKINDVTYNLNRYYEIGDLLLTIRAGDAIALEYERTNTQYTTTEYTIQSSDFEI